mmetsp:Transcript_90938/g.229230  ORF Transcript_90938/g.229230 Transcript_90938/m.229230 type:complete len:325 (-) Transcript_90938:542-1516(-)
MAASALHESLTLEVPVGAPLANASMLPLSMTTASPAVGMSMAALSAQWMLWAAESQRMYHKEIATPSTSATSSPRRDSLPTPRASPALPRPGQGGCSLRLQELLQLQDSTSGSPCGATGNTSASSSPREESLVPSLGLLALPQLVSPPPGLSVPAFRPPPGLPHPPVEFLQTSQLLPTAASTQSLVSVDWRIQNVFSRLRVSAGFALVSPPLQLGDLSDVRLQFSPGEGWAASARNPKSKATHMRPEGKSKGRKDSEHGTVSLKLGDAARGETLKFYLFVGSMRQGPFECNFAEQVVHELQLKVDWRKHLEAGSLPLCLQLVQE